MSLPNFAYTRPVVRHSLALSRGGAIDSSLRAATVVLTNNQLPVSCAASWMLAAEQNSVFLLAQIARELMTESLTKGQRCPSAQKYERCQSDELSEV